MAKDTTKTPDAKPGTAAVADARPLWKRALGIGKRGGDQAKSSGTSPPANSNGQPAATPAATAPATVAMGTPPDVDFSGFIPEGAGDAAPPKPTVDGSRIAKRATVALGLGVKHYPVLCGIVFHTDDFGAMPALINEHFDGQKGLSEPERQALWQMVAGMLWRHAAVKFAAPAGADEAARKAARKSREEAIAKFVDAMREIDPLSPMTADDLRAFQAALNGAIGQAIMHDALKAPDKLTKPTPAEAKADDTGEFKIAGDDPPPGKKSGGGGTPIMPAPKPASPTKPAAPKAKPKDDDDGGPKVPRTGGGGRGPKPLAAAATPPAPATSVKPKPGEGETIGLAEPDAP